MKYFRFINMREIFYQESLHLTILLVKNTQSQDICSLLEWKGTEMSIVRFSRVEISPPTHLCVIEMKYISDGVQPQRDDTI